MHSTTGKLCDDAKDSILPGGKPSLTASSTEEGSGEPSAASVAGSLGSSAPASPGKGGTQKGCSQILWQRSMIFCLTMPPESKAMGCTAHLAGDCVNLVSP